MTIITKSFLAEQQEEAGALPSIGTLSLHITTNNIENKSGLYCILFDNDKFYIGRSNNIRKRIVRHINELTKQKHCNSYLQRVFNKYVIKQYIIYYCDNPITTEAEALKKFYGKDKCLNLSKQNAGGYSYNKNHPRYKTICSKISNSNKGRKISKESIAKAVATRKANGYKISEETKAKLSKTSSGFNNGMYGKNHTKSSIKLMEEKKRKYKEEYHWLNLETGEEIICSVYELENNWGACNVRHLISGRNKSSNGWILI
jgi:group I intron endonuclease